MGYNKKGLTLVELIVTFCVIIVLAGAALVGLNVLDRSNSDFDNHMAANYQDALKYYVTTAIRDKRSLNLDDPQLVSNAITKVEGQNHLEFTCRVKNHKMYYNPLTLEVVVSEYSPTDNFLRLVPGDASGQMP